MTGKVFEKVVVQRLDRGRNLPPFASASTGGGRPASSRRHHPRPNMANPTFPPSHEPRFCHQLALVRRRRRPHPRSDARTQGPFHRACERPALRMTHLHPLLEMGRGLFSPPTATSRARRRLFYDNLEGHRVAFRLHPRRWRASRHFPKIGGANARPRRSRRQRLLEFRGR